MERVAFLIATGVYCGYAPLAPGTVGAAAGVGLYLLACGARWSAAVLLVGATLLLGAGVWAATVAARRLGQQDPRVVVVDEIVGMLVTFGDLAPGGVGLVIGFLLFRLFDVLKPYPADRLERLPGGWGIMADDIVAGLYAHLALRALAWAGAIA